MRRVVILSEKNYEDFELVRPFFERVVNEACHGEFNTDDLKKMLIRGYAWGAYVLEDEKPVIAWMWEMVFFPQKTTANVMALGGMNLAMAWDKYGEMMCDLWRSQGADAVTCYSNRAMARILGRYGFKPIYYSLERSLK